MIYKLFFAILLVNSQPDQETSLKPVVHSVCDILENPGNYDHKEITVESFLTASKHAAVINEETCHKGIGIYVSHETGRSDGNWPAFDSALVKKASGLETAPLRVRVRGVFRNRVRHGKTTIYQLELTEILEVAFQSKTVNSGARAQP